VLGIRCKLSVDKLKLEILARAFLGGLVQLHGREHAACILTRLAEGVRAGLPVDGEGCRHDHFSRSPSRGR
jgi:hypothetical protein